MLPNYYMATLHISDIRRALLKYPCLEEETSMQMVSWLIGVNSNPKKYIWLVWVRLGLILS